jgi:hypothetical protein
MGTAGGAPHLLVSLDAGVIGEEGSGAETNFREINIFDVFRERAGGLRVHQETFAAASSRIPAPKFLHLPANLVERLRALSFAGFRSALTLF